jgi:EAL domain-containing protein (putative c-di-GMP-specific phosphodiesterase class I)/GGDEF domain-containing protein
MAIAVPVKAPTSADRTWFEEFTRASMGKLRVADALSSTLPDLAVLIRRDGVVLDFTGGRDVGALALSAQATGQHIEVLWPNPVAVCIMRALRRAIAQRKTIDTTFKHEESGYELRAVARGPDRALCVIRTAAAGSTEESGAADELARPQFDRRGFLKRFHDTLAQAAIQEQPAALALLYLDGVAEIARVVDSKVADQVLSGAILRIPEVKVDRGREPAWYVGQLSAELLAMVVESSDREAIEGCVARICTSLREPVSVGDAAFHLTPYAGVSILGQDGNTPKSLLDKARSAAAEARRSASAKVFFFTDTLKLRSLARLDVAREIRDAIADRQIRLRYIGRHELDTGRLVAQLGYLRWTHPLRGEVSPREFLGVAETTGLATLLSRAMLEQLNEDFGALASSFDDRVRISFGALRHHLLQEDFADDIERLLATGPLPAERLELRISERTFAAMDASIHQSLRGLGVQLVVDEVGRGFASLDRLARAPIWGLQLDRAWVTALRTDPLALKVCRAGISAASALGLMPIATGVDDAAQRDALLKLGCRYGSGDLYAERAGQFDTLIMRRGSQSAS